MVLENQEIQDGGSTMTAFWKRCISLSAHVVGLKGNVMYPRSFVVITLILSKLKRGHFKPPTPRLRPQRTHMDLCSLVIIALILPV